MRGGKSPGQKSKAADNKFGVKDCCLHAESIIGLWFVVATSHW